MSACRSVSTRPSIEPTPPVVRCKQSGVGPVRAAPRRDEWLAYAPPKPGATGPGAAYLSEAAAAWIVDVLAAVEKLRGVQAVTDKCLDDHEKKGLIRQ